jgi:hypothetical protein
MAVSDERVRAALVAWFSVTLKGTAPHIREDVYASHFDRMKTTLEASDAHS